MPAPSASSSRVRTPGTAASRILARIEATSAPARCRPSSSDACSMVIVDSQGVRAGSLAALGMTIRPAAGWSLQRLEPQALGTGVVAHAAALVLFVLAVIALEELDVAVALEGQDMGRDAVEEPAVVRDHEGVAGELQQRVFQRAQGLD